LSGHTAEFEKRKWFTVEAGAGLLKNNWSLGLQFDYDCSDEVYGRQGNEQYQGKHYI
jgi:hypothetical protein